MKTLLLAIVTLAWTGVDDATHYKIYWGENHGVYLYSQDGIETTEYTVTINRSGTFYFVVTAKNASGESAYSNEVSATVAVNAPCDLNGDARVDVLDLQLLARAIVREETQPAMDLNQDGTVNVIDLQKLSRVILGIQACQ